MENKFNKALLLCSASTSLHKALRQILAGMSDDTHSFEVSGRLSRTDLRLNAQLYRMPYAIRKRWEAYLLKRANKVLLTEIKDYDPDVVLVYNSEFLLPETCIEIRKRSKLIFYTADSPFFTPVNDYYFSCLSYADLILVPDSFWIEQLKTTGLQNLFFFIPGIDDELYFSVGKSGDLKEIAETEVLYTGTSYANSWGYKKALLMSKFTGFNFNLYGSSMWKRWFRFFPDLESHFTETGYIPTKTLNRMFNLTKIIPVDGNPAILNGFHLRLFEAIGAGALPLAEYRKDINNTVFSKCRVKVPLITDYNKAADMAAYFLKHEEERKGIADELRTYVHETYNPEINAELLMSLLKKTPVR